jgi:hypothetical protein
MLYHYSKSCSYNLDTGGETDICSERSQIARSSGMDEHTETRMLEIKEENVLLKEQIRSLDSKLTQAKSVSPPQPN